MFKKINKVKKIRQKFWGLALLLLALALTGCGQSAKSGLDPAEIDQLQPGESAEIAITPELRESFFKLGRMEDWFHMPNFSSPEELPTDPLYYWFMLMAEGRTGWDEYGNLTGPSPWLYYGQLDIENYFDIMGIDENGDIWDSREFGVYTMVSRAEFDDWVRQHFGQVQLEHQITDDAWHGKNFYFDGENYYFTCMEGLNGPFNLWELKSLEAANEEGRIVYTAAVNLCRLYEYGFVDYYEPWTYEENLTWLEESMEYSPENRPVYQAYKQELLAGDINLFEAMQQMIIDGDTADFVYACQLKLRFYIDEQTGEPFYLQSEEIAFSD